MFRTAGSTNFRPAELTLSSFDEDFGLAPDRGRGSHVGKPQSVLVNRELQLMDDALARSASLIESTGTELRMRSSRRRLGIADTSKLARRENNARFRA